MSVNITRGNSATALANTRKNTVPGTVFVGLGQNGRMLDNRYAAITSNGRMWSINLGNGLLAGTNNGDKLVAPQGTFEYKVRKRVSADCAEVRRDSLRVGDAFTVRGGKVVYGSLGHSKDYGFLAVNFKSDDYTKSARGDQMVVKVGTWSILTKEV